MKDNVFLYKSKLGSKKMRIGLRKTGLDELMQAPYCIFDGQIFQGEDPRGKTGELRTSWLLLRSGDNRVMRNGRECVLRLSGDDIAAAVRHHAAKGEKIPLDSRHALFFSAQAAGVDEAEMLRTVPQGIAAMGFGDLAERDGNLWIVDVEWLPLAAELFRQGQLRYFSPVIRGLGTPGNVRVTSVALDNVPALCDLDILAASGEVPGHELDRHEEETMEKLEAALRKLLGDDALVLAAESADAMAEKIEVLAAELPKLRERAAQADTLEQAAETSAKDALISEALADGRVCNAQKPVLLQLSTAALGEFLAAIPKGKTVPVGAAAEADQGATVSLTGEEQRMARSIGIDEAAMLEEKKRLTINGGLQ